LAAATSAVLRQTLDAATDDLQAMQYYYGTGAVLCVSNATTMCLNNGRFKLTVSWVSPTASGLGQQVPLTTDTGYFWFFASTNVEMVVKVLNACGVNAHYWVFAGGLTNVAVTMTVTDMQTGRSGLQHDPGPAFLPIQGHSRPRPAPNGPRRRGAGGPRGAGGDPGNRRPLTKRSGSRCRTRERGVGIHVGNSLAAHRPGEHPPGSHTRTDGSPLATRGAAGSRGSPFLPLGTMETYWPEKARQWSHGPNSTRTVCWG
jgi:hypothetical protein